MRRKYFSRLELAGIGSNQLKSEESAGVPADSDSDALRSEGPIFSRDHVLLRGNREPSSATICGGFILPGSDDPGLGKEVILQIAPSGKIIWIHK